MFGIITGILEQGLIFGIMALGVYITVNILDFPDLSVDGTFPLGGAVAACLILRGANPWLALLCAFVCGCLAGMLTGFFHVKLKIPDSDDWDCDCCKACFGFIFKNKIRLSAPERGRQSGSCSNIGTESGQGQGDRTCDFKRSCLYGRLHQCDEKCTI